MHRNVVCFLLAATVASAVTVAQAATPSSTITRQSLISSDPLNRLSVGADYVMIERGVEGGGARELLQARVFSGYIGYDVVPWITLFATLGGAQLEADDDYWSSGTKWSLGIAPNLWEGELRRPAFLAGRLSIAAMGEAASYESSEGNDSADWMEYSAALFIRYEVLEDAPWSADSVTSLRLSAGPMLSVIRGDGKSAGIKRSFSESESVGWMAGIEWFIAPTFSVAGGAEVFKDTTVSGSVRLHF